MEEDNEGRKQKSGNSVSNIAKEKGKEVVKEKAKEEIKKKAAKETAKKAATKTATKLAAKSSLMAALGPILVWAAIIIVAIIILVGIIMFFMTVPGMVMDKLKSFTTDLAKSLASFYGADSTAMISDEEKYEVLDYLEQMGYDLKGYGFISENVDSSDPNYDEKQGVIRDPDTGKIKEARTDIIGMYIMSDNYVYTVKNFNEVGLLAFLKSLYKTAFPIIGIALDNLTDGTQWGKGLISIHFEDGGAYEKNIVDQKFGTNTSYNNIKIDPEAKTMDIRRGWGSNYYSYKLDGWTGRYGMPLDFLLSLHIATMKPDLTYEMIAKFDTNVDMRLKEIGSGDAEVVASYKIQSGGFVTFPQIEKALTGNEGRHWYSAAWDWFDDLVIAEDEAKAVFALGVEHAESCDCPKNDSGDLTGVGSNCKQHIKDILSELKNTNDYHFETYIPYIKKVENHWFRDVYFELDSDEAQKVQLSRTDLDYEKKTNERWTKYEIYEDGENAGEYKLYKYDENAQNGIGELYSGTQADADKDGIKVVKKPVETYAKNLADEDIITLKDDGSWSAYKDEDTSASDYKKAYPDSEQDPIKSKIYYKDSINSNKVQKEDGVRGITNATIKDMFLNRNYFTYDGTSKTADIIEQLRSDLGIKYGEIPESKLDNEYTVQYKTEKGTTESETVKVKDYASTVSLTQDSLAAFSMLENTHTLDADYIYKDFKELIVELGYFRKEELSDGRAKVLEFLVPDIGSNGYPKRILDKKENEYGTELHSKEDYEAKTADDVKASGKSNAENGPSSDEQHTVEDRIETAERNTNTYVENAKNNEKSIKTLIQDADERISNCTNEDNKKSIEEEKANYVKIQEEIETIIQEINQIESEIKQLNEELKNATDDSQKENILNNVNLKNEEILKKQQEIEAKIPKEDPWKNVGHGSKADVPQEARSSNLLLSKKIYNLEKTLESGKDKAFGININQPTIDVKNTVGEATSFKKDTLIDTATACWQYIVDSGKYTYAGASIPPTNGTTIDCSSYVSWVLYEYGFEEFAGGQHCTSEFYNTNWNEAFGWEEIKVGPGEDCSSQIQAGDLFVRDDGANHGHIQFILSVEDGEIMTYDCGAESHWVKENREGYKSNFTKSDSKNRPGKIIRIENAKSTGGNYEGFEGNEAVVSPVSGILLDYGTYTPEDVDKLTGQKYRQNSDKKEKNDEVGYAKILVLNEEIADQIVSCKDHNSDGLVTVDTKPANKDELDKLSLAQKGLYGYDLFAEDYENAGIAGYVIYIDGFKCELPNANSEKENDGSEGSSDTTSNVTSEQPSVELTMDYLKEKAAIGGESNFKEGEYTETRYEPDPTYKLISEAIEEKQKAEVEAKNIAVPLYKFAGQIDEEYKDDWILIKEGTVLGRTMTNKELVENLRNETYTAPKSKDEKNTTNASTANTATKNNSTDNNSTNTEEEQRDVEGNYLRIIMRDLDDTIVENVEDYMKLDTGDEKSRSEVDWEFYYWLPYESGPMDNESGGPAAANWTTPGELACGIAQWTTYKGCNNIGPLCEWLIAQDSSLCSELSMFTSITSGNVTSMGNQFITAWKSVAAKDRDKFLELQMNYFYENDFEKFITGGNITKSDISGWIKEKPMVMQGTLASLMNWGQYLGWEKPEVISQSNDDKTNIRNLLKKACGIGSTAGNLSSRWTSQYVLAIDILEGTFTEVEEWIRTGQPASKYGQGKNPGSLSVFTNFLNLRNMYTYANK